MSYHVELVIKFPIDSYANLKTLFFDHLSQKNVMVTLMKK